jgi:hypothetical protein
MTWLLALTSGGLLLTGEAQGQAPVPFKPAAWYTALSEEFKAGFIQVQVGTAPEGPVVKAVFDDSLKAALPVSDQEEAARTVAQYIARRAAAEPALAVIIVGWRGKVEGLPVAQIFRFPAATLLEGPAKPTTQ